MMAEMLSYRLHEEIDFIMEGPVCSLHSMADEVATLEQQNTSLQQRVEALERDQADWHKGVELIRYTLERWFGYKGKEASPVHISEFLMRLAAAQEQGEA